MNCLLTRVFIGFFIVIFSTDSMTALFAISKKTIEGHSPELTSKDLFGINKIGFRVDGTVGENFDASSPKGKLKTLPPALKYKDFTPVVSSAFVKDDFFDLDGDTFDHINIGEMSLTWLDSNSNKLPDSVTKPDNIIGCGTSVLPAKLQVNVSSLEIVSTYGTPRNNILPDFSLTYDVGFSDGFCYVKPADMTIFNGAKPDLSVGGGYISTEFDPNKGFFAANNPPFPTTAFDGAKFSFTMVRPNNEYTFSLESSGNGAVIFNADTQELQFKAKPSGSIVVKAINKTTKLAYEYKFSIDAGKWFFSPEGGPKTRFKQDLKDALVACKNVNPQATIAKREQLTNSPHNPKKWVKNYYTRAINNSLTGEWGPVSVIRKTDGSQTISGGIYWRGDQEIGFLDGWHYTGPTLSVNETVVVDPSDGAVHTQGGITIVYPIICNL